MVSQTERATAGEQLRDYIRVSSCLVSLRCAGGHDEVYNVGDVRCTRYVEYLCCRTSTKHTLYISCHISQWLAGCLQCCGLRTLWWGCGVGGSLRSTNLLLSHCRILVV